MGVVEDWAISSSEISAPVKQRPLVANAGLFYRCSHSETSCPFFEPSWFWKQLPKEKIAIKMCYIWYNHVVWFMIRTFSASYVQLLNVNLRSLTLSQIQTRLYSSARYNQSHTILLSLLMQWPIRDVQMSPMSSGRPDKEQKTSTSQFKQLQKWYREFLRQKSW